jgi:hypothetical protein
MRVFMGRFQFGQFDPGSKMPWDELTGDAVYSAENQQIALEGAQQSATLLRNPAGKAQLPLKKGAGKRFPCFWSHCILKMIGLPRQARDKHWNS